MIEVLTPCPDSGEFTSCARRCDHEGEPTFIPALGAWFHIDEILTPQERTARAHAEQQRKDFIDEKVREAADRIRAKTRAYEDLFFGPGMMGEPFFGTVRREPSDPRGTLPPGNPA